MSDSITLTAHCLCKLHNFTTQVPKSRLPLPAYVCHCTSCRHSTGALYSIDLPWPAHTRDVDISALQTFHFSSKTAIHFCGTCSTPIFFGHPADPDADLGVFTGALTNPAADLVNLKTHIFVEDTQDGGASVWLQNVNADGSEAKRYKHRAEAADAEELPASWPDAAALTGFEKRTADKLNVKCKCGGIEYALHRGDYKDGDDLPWFVVPKTHKLIAGHCVCDSCRLFSGIDVFPWTFAELKNLSFKDGKKVPADMSGLKAAVDSKEAGVGSLKYYASSPGVLRFFCGTCSACVFFASDDRPKIVDVAVGVLDAPDGARAEGFLAWSFAKIQKVEDVKGGWREGLVDRVQKEIQEWRSGRGYPNIGDE
ncbi:hypothetical protein M011DRAFT_399774 [Sporormia fimetaria CBS 119925]|uniref:CENP-V/GFA domain-containing protein n=1 Tax=Sporormia fimetaria CBS 119925 TaxID=1340428 RepID=A0A6A6VEL2_9PLEO|nr:hypothetical protein M011DRAFT_399774 [Sporormia fimetaria CBS 119925]